MKIRPILFLLCGMAGLGASAHSVALEENFNGDYTASFPLMLELDHLNPLANVRPIFMDNDGVCRPWWKVKDSSASQDGFLGSHSAYSPAGKSNDWIVSRPVEIPTEGYTLSFGAQSYVMRQGDRLSDLRVYISETPVDADNLPEEPAMLIEKVSEGKFPEDIENDFTEYSLPLDQWAGKTVWIAFANLNEDKDLLLIDNVLVRRLDAADLTAVSPEYAEAGTYNVTGTLTASTDVDVKNWTLSLDSDDSGMTQIRKGGTLKAGESVDFKFTCGVKADEMAEWKLTLTADDIQPITAEGKVQGLGFIPFHRVLLEESTGTWCGNCPLGMYAVEQMILHEEMGEYVVPVSVHIKGSGRPDYMENENYSYLFAVNSAPALRMDRSLNVTYFSTAHDVVPADPENPLSVAHAVRERHKEISLFDIQATASLVVEGNDTTAVKANVELIPAMTLPSSRYGVGFILTENNVTLSNPNWAQENYLSGVSMATNLDGLTEMPSKMYDWRFQDVAREVYGYHGYDGFEFPEKFALDNTYKYSATLPIPDTYKEIDGTNDNKIVVSPAVVAANLTLIAYIVDKENDYRVVNSIAVPLTDQAEERSTIAKQYEAWKLAGVETAGVEDLDAAPEYYTLTGMKTDRPTEGVYIVKRGSKIEKKIIHNN